MTFIKVVNYKENENVPHAVISFGLFCGRGVYLQLKWPFSKETTEWSPMRRKDVTKKRYHVFFMRITRYKFYYEIARF